MRSCNYHITVLDVAVGRFIVVSGWKSGPMHARKRSCEPFYDIGLMLKGAKHHGCKSQNSHRQQDYHARDKDDHAKMPAFLANGKE